jgi:hypothetical protein
MNNIEQLLKEELFKTDYCFSTFDLFNNPDKFDNTKKLYGFSLIIGNFLCYANDDNLHKIIKTAQKYNLDYLFLNTVFHTKDLLTFNKENIKKIKKIYLLPDNLPPIFWFTRAKKVNRDTMLILKDYLESSKLGKDKIR